MHWVVCVVPLYDDAILGLDILDTLGAVINLRIPSVTLNGRLTRRISFRIMSTGIYKVYYHRATKFRDDRQCQHK